MFGFIGSFGSSEVDFDTVHAGFDKQGVKENSLTIEGLLKIYQKTNGKFDNDKVFYSDDEMAICSDGLIYNLDGLKINTKRVDIDTSLVEGLYALYKKHGDSFAMNIDGCYSIALYDNASEKLVLASDHTAMKSMYYVNVGEVLLFSTDYVWLARTLSRYAGRCRLNYDGAYCLLSYGYMLDGLTLIDGIKKILPGHVLTFRLDKIRKISVEESEYFNWSSFHEESYDYDELLQKADAVFTTAIDKRYKKDKEYGYSHVCTLSGGLDSRSILFVSKALGYEEQLTLTMSQTETLDETIAKQIASDLQVENYFYSLNQGNYLKSIDRAIELNGGLVTYPGLVHSERLFYLTNLSDFGAIHSGEDGDAIFGGHDEPEYYQEADYKHGAFSLRYIDRISQSIIKSATDRCKTKYLYFLMERGLNGSINGWFSATPYTEYTSAFLDRNFLEFILTVPAKYKANSAFYIDWMKKYHGKTCEYKWEKTNAFPDAGDIKKKWGKGTKILSRRLFRNPKNMNPYQYWMKSNASLQIYYDDYYNKTIDIVSDNEIKSTLQDLYLNGIYSEKMQALTLLGAIKQLSINI